MNSPTESTDGVIKDILDDLINKITIDEYNSKGDTKLTGACADSNEKQVNKLLISGADPNKMSKDGWTPLGIASQEGNLNIVSNLIKHGANVNLKIPGNMNCIALHVASSGINPDGVMKEHLAIVKLLIKHGGNPNAKTDNSRTPLMFASGVSLSESIGINSAKIIRELIDNGAEVDSVTKQLSPKKIS